MAAAVQCNLMHNNIYGLSTAFSKAIFLHSTSQRMNLRRSEINVLNQMCIVQYYCFPILQLKHYMGYIYQFRKILSKIYLNAKIRAMTILKMAKECYQHEFCQPQPQNCLMGNMDQDGMIGSFNNFRYLVLLLFLVFF